MRKLKHMKRCDFILIAILIFMSLIPYFINFVFINNQGSLLSVEITIDGKLFDKIPLEENFNKNIKVSTKHGFNLIQIRDKTVTILDADCNDKICVDYGTISKAGEIIVCLPHKLVVEIKGEKIDTLEPDSVSS